MRKAFRSQSTKSMRSNKSRKSTVGSDLDATTLDFGDLLTESCKKLSAVYNVVVKRDYRIDDYLRSLKEVPGKSKQMQTKAPLSTDTDETPDSVNNVPEVADAIIERLSVGIILITAIYDYMNNLSEVLLQQQRVPKDIVQILGLITPYFTKLTKLSMKRCRINGCALHEMKKFLPLTSIKEVCLDGSPLCESNYAVLLDSPCRITNLSLCRCEICDEVCVQIASKLHYTKSAEATLASLNLSSNHITDVGAGSIGGALRTNRHLRYLNLADNRVSDDGADRILSALIDFRLTYDEIVDKRHRYLKFLKGRRDAYLAFITDCDTKAVDITTLKSTGRNRSATKLRRATKLCTVDDATINAKAEMASKKMAGEFSDPFASTKLIDGYPYCIGNMALCYLNLSYNKLSYITIKKICSTLEYQSLQLDQTGLLKVVIDGNPIPISCVELDYISNVLQKKVIKFGPKFPRPQEEKRKALTASKNISISPAKN